MTTWPTPENPGIASIGPTGSGTYGIWWRHFEAMENRGGYSGPYRTRAEAEAGARDWAQTWEAPLELEWRGNLRPPQSPGERANVLDAVREDGWEDEADREAAELRVCVCGICGEPGDPLDPVVREFHLHEGR